MHCGLITSSLINGRAWRLYSLLDCDLCPEDYHHNAKVINDTQVTVDA